MSNFTTFFAMGGYGAYIWPAYGLTAFAFVGMLVWTLAALRARRREEKALAAVTRPRREARR